VKAIDVQPGQYVQGRNLSGRVSSVHRGVGIGWVEWGFDDGRTARVPAATDVEAW
jgi:hypothetical protein